MSADTGFSTVVVFIILEETSKLKKTKQNKCTCHFCCTFLRKTQLYINNTNFFGYIRMDKRGATQLMCSGWAKVEGDYRSVLALNVNQGRARQSEPFASQSHKPGTCAAADHLPWRKNKPSTGK